MHTLVFLNVCNRLSYKHNNLHTVWKLALPIEKIKLIICLSFNTALQGTRARPIGRVHSKKTSNAHDLTLHGHYWCLLISKFSLVNQLGSILQSAYDPKPRKYFATDPRFIDKLEITIKIAQICCTSTQMNIYFTGLSPNM